MGIQRSMPWPPSASNAFSSGSPRSLFFTFSYRAFKLRFLGRIAATKCFGKTRSIGGDRF